MKKGSPAGGVGRRPAEAGSAFGRYSVRLSQNPSDLAASQALRHLCFVEAAGGRLRPGGIEADDRDPHCLHLMVEEIDTGLLVCTCRMMQLPSGKAISQCYTAQFYDLGRLEGYGRPMLELGRFCIRPHTRDADILRLAWGALTRIVDDTGVGMVFGCSSFAGTDPDPYRSAFALLAEAYGAPPALAPGPRAAAVVSLAGSVPADRRGAIGALPPLLRTYLGMGGWVSDHGVIDSDLGTIHVFTAVETDAVPPSRARALRAIAGTGA